MTSAAAAVLDGLPDLDDAIFRVAVEPGYLKGRLPPINLVGVIKILGKE